MYITRVPGAVDWQWVVACPSIQQLCSQSSRVFCVTKRIYSQTSTSRCTHSKRRGADKASNIRIHPWSRLPRGLPSGMAVTVSQSPCASLLVCVAFLVVALAGSAVGQGEWSYEQLYTTCTTDSIYMCIHVVRTPSNSLLLPPSSPPSIPSLLSMSSW